MALINAFSTPAFRQGRTACPLSSPVPFSGVNSAVDTPLSPKFGGATKHVRGREWLSPQAFQALMNVMPIPYVGKLPKPFIAAMPKAPKQVYQSLDELADILRQVQEIEVPMRANIGDAKQPVTLQAIGSGNFGTVYRLMINHHAYALKVFHDLREVSAHGTYGEVGTGLYFSNEHLRDLAKFYFGNPKAGWGVFELIEPGMPVRHGKSIGQFPVVIQDAGRENEIDDVRVDYGGILKRQVSAHLQKHAVGVLAPTMEDFRQAMVSGNLGEIPYYLPKNQKEDAYRLAMASNKTTLQTEITAMIEGLPRHFQKEAFEMAMKTGKPEVQAAAVRQIVHLPVDLRVDAFEMAMKTGESVVQAAGASQICALPDHERKQAFETAMAIDDVDTQIAACLKFFALPKDFVVEGFRVAMATNDPRVQAAVVPQIYYLPDEEQRKDAFKDAMAIHDSAVRSAAMHMLFKLPKDFRMSAFQMAMATGDPVVQSAAANEMYYLPQHDQAKALVLYLQAAQANRPFHYLTNLAVI